MLIYVSYIILSIIVIIIIIALGRYLTTINTGGVAACFIAVTQRVKCLKRVTYLSNKYLNTFLKNYNILVLLVCNFYSTLSYQLRLKCIKSIFVFITNVSFEFLYLIYPIHKLFVYTFFF